MIFNNTASYELISQTLYSKDFYKKLQKSRMIAVVMMIVSVFLAIILLLICTVLKTKSVPWIILISIACGLLVFQLLYSLFMAFYNTVKIKKSISKRYYDWIHKYYILCSDNFSNFQMHETETQNEYLCKCSSGIEFLLTIDRDFIKITKGEDNEIYINNKELHLFCHDVEFNDAEVSTFKKDYYFVAIKDFTNKICKYIESDILYILNEVNKKAS